MTREVIGALWVCNHPGLDLVNTEAVDAHGDRLELVVNWAALVDWTETAGLIDAELSELCRAAGERQARAVLAWFRRLRAALRAVLESGDQPEAAQALGAAVGEIPVRLSVWHADSGPPVDATTPLDQLRLALAIAALDATRLDRSRVRRCGSPRCVLLYYDTTKNRSRRWCDMAVCGNRAKASAHYHRSTAARQTRRPEESAT
jgi:predicted RNA-binding Zn ribbon-like protein